MMIVACEQCGKEFEAKRSTAKYCSASCRHAAWEARQVNVKNANSLGGVDLDALAAAIDERAEQRLSYAMQQQAENMAAMFTELDARNQQRHEELLLALQPPKGDDLPQDIIGLLTIIAENSSTETPMIRKMANALEEIADRLKRLENQPRAAAPNHAAQQPQLAPRANASDDELLASLEVTEAEYDEDNNSSYNFILSMAGLATGNAEFNLTPEVYEYAVRTGRISPPASDGPKAMDVPKIELPEEIEIDESLIDSIDIR